MKVVCLQENLQHGLAQVSRAVATRTSLPALSNVLISTDEGRLRIAASDFNIAITTWVGASVEEEGKVAVDARLLADFVSTLPNDNVTLSSERGKYRLDVQSGRDHAEINGIEPDDFPVIPTVSDDAQTTTIDSADLREMITMVEFAAATDESRPVLAGVLLRLDGDAITMAAADGFRLAVRQGKLNELFTPSLDVIVPAKAMRELGRLLAEASEPAILYVTPNQGQMIARFGDIEFLSRLIEGSFPDYRQIVPREYSTKVDLGRDALLTAVKRSSYFARDNNDAIRLAIKPGEDELTPGLVEVSANAAERGNSQSFVDAAIEGPEIQVAFNARYLNDVLGVIKGGQATLGLNGANQAGVIHPTGDDAYTHVIMPMVIGTT
ncbi:MAG: DNA polymerase III subunit beta [Thermomicrobiales bacterium]|nr:DNA polymerase III subunit beta [Thermomicrobiales bacterium]